MKVFYSTTFLLATISFTTVLSDSTNPCQHVADAYINDPSECSAYFECKDQQTIPGNCPNGLWFNKRNGMCDYKENVECDTQENGAPCENKKDGEFVSNPASCHAYYYCKNGEAHAGDCPNGLVFHPDTQTCKYAEENDRCHETVQPSNVCENIPDNIMVRDANLCAVGYLCFANTATKFSCAEEAVFDLKTGACVEKGSIVCKDTSANDDELCKDAKIEGQYVADPISCAGYYYCKDKKSSNHGVCPKDQWFIAKEERCEWSDAVSAEDCKNRCEGKHDIFVVAPGTDCQKYHYCKNGAMQGTSECGPDLIFDFKTQTCADKATHDCAF